MKTLKINNETLYEWNLGPSRYLAWPEKGARLMQWDIKLSSNRKRPIIYWPERADLSTPRKIRGGNPILFPFTVFTYHEGEAQKWQPSPGQVLSMPKHGFALDAPFKLVRADAYGFKAQLENPSWYACFYPFKYTFSVEYLFSDYSLDVLLTLSNEDDVAIPWSCGHHFYFEVPWDPQLQRKHYQVNIPAKRCLHRDEKDNPLKPTKPEMPTLLNNPDLIDRTHCQLKSPISTLSTANNEEHINISMSLDGELSKWLSINTWTESPEAPFYCLEPWLSPTNALKHKKGLQYVKPGKSQCFKVTISTL